MKKVRKVKPLKKIPETDAIFYSLAELHEKNKDKENVVRISIDTKDRVKIGDFSKGFEAVKNFVYLIFFLEITSYLFNLDKLLI